MSKMLEQAIIDAESLKEAALNNAEKIIIEKYSHEIKEAMDSLLEEPEEAMIGGETTPDMPRADLDGEEIEGVETSEEGDAVEINLGELAKALEEAEESGESLDVGDMISRETEIAPELPTGEEEQVDDEELELSEEQISSILEKLAIDVKNVPTGQAGGASNKTMENEIKDILVAEEGEEELEEELEEDEEKNELKESLENLQNENKNLLDKTEKYKNLLIQLNGKLEEVNLSNAKLLYTNRVLGSTSLNERQKIKIVEALSKVDSVEGAKVIFETLQSAVGSERKRTPKSLSEAIQRSSTTLPRRKEENKSIPHKDRWKTLAGIK